MTEGRFDTAISTLRANLDSLPADPGRREQRVVRHRGTAAHAVLKDVSTAYSALERVARHPVPDRLIRTRPSAGRNRHERQLRARSTRGARGDRHGNPRRRRRGRPLGRPRHLRARLRLPRATRRATRSGPRDHPRRRHLRSHDAGRRRDRLDGVGRSRGHREATQADHPHRPADGVPLLDRRRDEQHHLPAAAGHLRRVVQEPHPPRAAAHGDRRPVRHGPGRLTRLCRHGGDADAHRRGALQPRPHPDPRDHHPVVRRRHRRHLARRQPDVEEPRRRPGGAGQDRLRRARRAPVRLEGESASSQADLHQGGAQLRARLPLRRRGHRHLRPLPPAATGVRCRGRGRRAHRHDDDHRPGDVRRRRRDPLPRAGPT